MNLNVTVDHMQIILDDEGNVKLITDDIGQANHTNAEKLVQQMCRMWGGTVTIEKRHSHGGASHSHDKLADHSH